MTEVRNRKGGAGSSVASTTAGLLHGVRDRVNTIYREQIDPVANAFRYRSRPSKGDEKRQVNSKNKKKQKTKTKKEKEKKKKYLSAVKCLWKSCCSWLTHSPLPTTGDITAAPLIFFLGNHSSGKSSFINFLLGRETLQKTGTAPLDDSFTILTHGDTLGEKDGPAIVSNTALPFSTLGNIGGAFVQHLKMKMVPDDLLRHVTLVDSPGMIDGAGGKERDYAFGDACKWFVERAGVCCLFCFVLFCFVLFCFVFGLFLFCFVLFCFGCCFWFKKLLSLVFFSLKNDLQI